MVKELPKFERCPLPLWYLGEKGGKKTGDLIGGREVDARPERLSWPVDELLGKNVPSAYHRLGGKNSAAD